MLRKLNHTPAAAGRAQRLGADAQHALRLFAARTGSSVNREHIQRLLGEAAKLTNHRDYVIIGSLSVLGTVATPPDTKTQASEW
jgi:AraC-like DNA-binding protein